MEPASRGTNALQRRAQQLKRWAEMEAQSDAATSAKKPTPPRIKFSNATLFLAACSNCDLDDCHRLLNSVDINVANIDGLTALHQACIDGNVDMVNFLIENGLLILSCCVSRLILHVF